MFGSSGSSTDQSNVFSFGTRASGVLAPATFVPNVKERKTPALATGMRAATATSANAQPAATIGSQGLAGASATGVGPVGPVTFTFVDTPTVQNSVHLGDQLLCRLRSGRPLVNVVKLLCKDEAERTDHRIVLETTSKYFEEKFNQLPESNDEPLSVPCTGVIFDIIQEYIYTSKLIQFEAEDAIQLFSAAKVLKLDDLADQVKSYLNNSKNTWLNSANFMKTDSKENVLIFSEIFAASTFNDEQQVLLLKKIGLWGTTLGIEDSVVRELYDAVLQIKPPTAIATPAAQATTEATTAPE